MHNAETEISKILGERQIGVKYVRSRNDAAWAPATTFATLHEWDQRNRLAAVVLKDNAGDITQRIEYRYDTSIT